MKADLERGSDSTAAALLDGDGWAPWTTSRQQSMVSKRTEHACVKQARAAASETPGGTAGPTESARAGQPRAYLRVFGVPSLGCEPGVQWQEPLTGATRNPLLTRTAYHHLGHAFAIGRAGGVGRSPYCGFICPGAAFYRRPGAKGTR